MHTLRFADRSASEFHNFHAIRFWERKYTNENATVVVRPRWREYFPAGLFFYDLLNVQLVVEHHLNHIDALGQRTQLIYQYTVIAVVNIE